MGIVKWIWEGDEMGSVKDLKNLGFKLERNWWILYEIMVWMEWNGSRMRVPSFHQRYFLVLCQVQMHHWLFEVSLRRFINQDSIQDSSQILLLINSSSMVQFHPIKDVAYNYLLHISLFSIQSYKDSINFFFKKTLLNIDKNLSKYWNRKFVSNCNS